METEEIVVKASTIHGAFLPDEMRMMITVAMALKKKANFVEIGCNLGRSSSVLGLIAKERKCNLVCIDNFIEVPNGISSSDEVKQQFEKNMHDVEAEYKLMAMDSKEASSKYRQEIDLLFIDGDHSYEGVKEDIRLWVRRVKKGGAVLFHDYLGSNFGVKKAVDEAKDLERITIIESMAVMKKL